MYYSARAQYLCLVDDGKLRKRVLCDEQTFVFRAGDRRRAFAKALRLARANELSYSNAKGQTVRWLWQPPHGRFRTEDGAAAAAQRPRS